MVTAWGHDGSQKCFYARKLTSCPRHPGTQLKEVIMPKITRHGGPTNFGLTDRSAGFVEPTLTPPADWVRPQNTADADLQDDAPVVDDKRTANDDDDETGDPPFDPGEFSVRDVVTELDNLTMPERRAVIKAERAGKGRAGILNA